MNERIRIFRESMNLSRSAFGEMLGISGDMVNNMERGRVEIKEDRIKLICSTFNVNEDWLRTGKGEPTIKRTRRQEIGEFANEVMDLPDENIKKRLIEALVKLNEKDWETIAKIADSLKEGS